MVPKAFLEEGGDMGSEQTSLVSTPLVVPQASSPSTPERKTHTQGRQAGTSAASLVSELMGAEGTLVMGRGK